jgi:hypothetical protein
MEIRDKVVDDFIDLLLSDQANYDERLDYFEVNFNAALAKDRIDAQNKFKIKITSLKDYMVKMTIFYQRLKMR